MVCGNNHYRIEVRNVITLISAQAYGGLVQYTCATQLSDGSRKQQQWFEAQAGRDEQTLCSEDSRTARAAVRCDWPSRLRQEPLANCETPSSRYWIEAVLVEHNSDMAPQNFGLRLAVDLVQRDCTAHVIHFKAHEPGAPLSCETDFELLYEATAQGLQNASLRKLNDCDIPNYRAEYVVTSAKGA